MEQSTVMSEAHDWVSQVLETLRSTLGMYNVCLATEHIQINIKQNF